MKKIAALLLCFSMRSAGALTAYAEEPNIAPGEATIGTEVPDSHKITIMVTGNAEAAVNGVTGTSFEVERLSEPELAITAKEGEKITKIIINGEDVTDLFVDGKVTIPAVYQDMELAIEVETETLPVESSESTPESKADSKSASTDSNSKAASTAGTSNPVTGVIGTVSVGGLAALAALTMIKRKNKDEE